MRRGGDLRGIATTIQRHGNIDWSVSFPEPVEKADKSTVVAVGLNAVYANTKTPIGPYEWQTRIAAVDDQGKEHPAELPLGMTMGGITQLTATFKDLPREQVKKVLLQGRPYTWVEFNNVTLNPRGRRASRRCRSAGRDAGGSIFPIPRQPPPRPPRPAGCSWRSPNRRSSSISSGRRRRSRIPLGMRGSLLRVNL